jgi:hypothetical protein
VPPLATGSVETELNVVPLLVTTPAAGTVAIPVTLLAGMLPVVPASSGRPVQFVKVPEVGVPNTGVTRVGEVDSTFEPEPVDAVTPVPPLATSRVPVIPVVSGRPVQLVRVPEVGVPKVGVVRVGEVRVGVLRVGEVSVLLVRVCVSVVPTTSPLGSVMVEKAFVLPVVLRIPAVNVEFPVPPFATEIGDEKVFPLPNVLLVIV